MADAGGAPEDLTDLLNAASDAAAAADPFARWYPQLRRIAGRILGGEGPHTLQPTALVHEAWLRMVDRERLTAEGTRIFKASFARECRRILVDAARRRAALARGGGLHRNVFDAEHTQLGTPGDVDVLVLQDALAELERRNQRMGRIAELRIFGGLTVPECAEVLSVSPRTVDEDWKFARTWLRAEVAPDRR